MSQAFFEQTGDCIVIFIEKYQISWKFIFPNVYFGYKEIGRCNIHLNITRSEISDGNKFKTDLLFFNFLEQETKTYFEHESLHKSCFLKKKNLGNQNG